MIKSPKLPIYFAVGLVTVGFALIGLAWNGAAGNDYVQGQVPYLISGGLTGLALVMSGLAVAVIQTRRADTLTLLQRIEELAAEPEPSVTPSLRAVPEKPMVVLHGRPIFHRPGCRLVEGRDDAELVDAAAASDLRPCRVCRPEARPA